MDLRGHRLDPEDYDQLLHFIEQRKLSYQPFRFDEEHEVGEGMAFLGGTSTDSRKGVVNWPHPPDDIADLLVPPSDLERFRYANDALRAVYDHFVASLCRALGENIADLDFAEYGCNTGYFPYSLSQRGARRTYGLDFTYNKAVFDFFNRKLGTNATFLFSEWDSFLHQPHYNNVPEVDVCLSVAVLCHLADPLHHLTYLCSRARRAVFVWTPSHQSDDLFMSFGRPGLFPNSLSWPVSFDNLVKPSRGLLELCLKASGFEDIRHLDPIPTQLDKIDFWNLHTGIVAFRTRDAATAYAGGAVRRHVPADAAQAAEGTTDDAANGGQTEILGPLGQTLRLPRLLNSVREYNIVAFKGLVYGVPQRLGPIKLEEVDIVALPGIICGTSEDSVQKEIEDRSANDEISSAT
jgi:hypothetical protein